MRIGEVSLLTNDVLSLTSFYKQLLEIENDSEDEIHQVLIAEETALTIYNDGSIKNNQNQNICLAFTVDDIEKEYKKVLAMGARIIEGPTKRPWGAINMSFYDPDNNMIFFRSFPKNS
ncbi:MAG: VOC family protein [Lachnospiraceae bacterium]|nr:VOC family protein [Lachnospiraceae bacterium]